MSEIEIIAIRSYPDKSDVPDEVVAHLDEDEMKACFLDALELDLFKTQDELTLSFINELNLALAELQKSKRFYQWNRLTREEYVEVAKGVLKAIKEKYLELGAKGFDKMLQTVKKRTRVRVNP